MTKRRESETRPDPVTAPPASTPVSAAPGYGASTGFGTPGLKTYGPGAVNVITGAINPLDLTGGNYLKGEDVPVNVAEVKFRITGYVNDPKGRSVLAASISELSLPGVDRKLFGFNTTNIRAVVALGVRDMQELVGRVVVCMIGMQPNPSRGGAPTRSLFVSRVE